MYLQRGKPELFKEAFTNDPVGTRSFLKNVGLWLHHQDTSPCDVSMFITFADSVLGVMPTIPKEVTGDLYSGLIASAHRQVCSGKANMDHEVLMVILCMIRFVSLW